MKLLLTRYLDGSDRTFGTLWLQESSIIPDDTKLRMVLTEICDTMEPRRRDLSREKKVKGSTAIPSGTYEIKFSPSAKFNRMMPYLVNVPLFEGIMFHPVFVHPDITAALQKTHGAADTGLGIAHILAHIDGADMGRLTGQHQNGLQIHLAGFLQMHTITPCT